MAATIQTIETPKRWRAQDTSGNNNHGQIYSGRGLEFDGVTDYLTVPDSSNYKLTDNVTVSFWSNMTTNDGWDSVFGHSSGFSNGLWLAFDAAGQLNCQLEGVVAHASFGSTVNAQENTWYRCVMTYSSSSGGVLYMNGQSVGTCSAAGTITQPAGAYQIGFTDTEYYFEGWLSDLQVWNTAWSADDVAFDYANPEQLALNRGGTSLTNSNLKIWYPMNDGHRGQQTYVLDASNTGLGDEMLLNTDFSSWTDDDPDDWSVVNEPGNGEVTQGTLNGGNSCRITQDPSESDNIYIQDTPSSVTVVGISYRFSFDLLEVASGAIQIDHGGSSVIDDNTTGIGDITTVGTHVGYFTATAVTGIAISRGSTGSDVTFTNVSLKPVNDKNHATTVFYGEEILADGNFASGTDSWGNDDATLTKSGDYSHSGSYSLKIVQSGTSYDMGIKHLQQL